MSDASIHHINFEEVKTILGFFDNMLRETFIDNFLHDEIALMKKIYDGSSESEKRYIEKYYTSVFKAVQNN